jgi:cytochrome c5
MQTRMAAIVALALAACASGARRDAPGAAPAPAPATAPDDDRPPPLAAEPQRPGDPARGWEVLTNYDYVGCGVPRAMYDRFAGGMPASWRLPGRTGRSAELPYFVNAATTSAGVDIVAASCLGCHAAFLRGQLVVGLGDASADFTADVDRTVGVGFGLAGLFAGDGAARAEWQKLSSRVQALAPHVRTRTVGANPADHIAAVLFAHRDPQTLAWSDEPLIALPPTSEPIPVDVPAWWLLRKKTAMFHVGAGRGDQARIMMTASVMCTDTVAEARAIDAHFPDVRAFLLTLEPPPFPGTIDPALAARGRETFEETCSHCHGTYGDGGRYETRIIPTAVVGTDPALAAHAGQFAAEYRGWFNRSFYGEVARLEPGDGYVAPPLDGVWATAPYLHNGSVQTLAELLDSTRRRPRFALHRGTHAYDLRDVGWASSDAAADASLDDPWTYDASRPGAGNQGHTFGDDLSADERDAVIEYLKTL